MSDDTYVRLEDRIRTMREEGQTLEDITTCFRDEGHSLTLVRDSFALAGYDCDVVVCPRLFRSGVIELVFLDHSLIAESAANIGRYAGATVRAFPVSTRLLSAAAAARTVVRWGKSA